MYNAIAEWLRLCSEPLTKRRVFSIAVFVSIAFAMIFIYEAYTSSFRLARLQKSTELLFRLHELERENTNNTPQIRKAKDALLDQAMRLMEVKPIKVTLIPSNLDFSMEALWKFLAGSAIWLFFGAFSLSPWNPKKSRKETQGILGIALFTGVIGIFIPPIWWPWFHLLVYPFIFILVVLGAIIIFANFWSARKQTQTNACINNLRQFDGAKQQWALETKQTSDAVPNERDIAPYIGQGNEASFPKCPLGGIYEINSVAACPTCSIPEHKINAP